MTVRPRWLVVVFGTGTEVGKTFVSARVLETLRRRGFQVSARKPVQSFEPGDGASDAEILAAATGEDHHVVCRPQRSLPRPMAPPMAAEALGLPPFTISDLVDEIEWDEGLDLGLVETAGGVRSPMASDGDAVDLAEAIGPDEVLLVADAGLGVISAVRLCVDALAGFQTLVYLNRFVAGDDLCERNLEWLTGRCGFTVLTTITELADRWQRALESLTTGRRNADG
ncbi:MAG: hypothetical protein KatS3mg008_0734 [Acidimicrobiales bacterium]|nr:MAG: hypothetical protein KatS3mg008_0734 [Acidimicrobiales bacterium]